MIKAIKKEKFENFKKFWCFMEDLNKLNNNFIWRGHSNANWRLSTTWNRYKISEKFNDNKMTEILKNFEANLARGGFYPFNEPVSKYKWLELARHYGVPTPLIDFSYSPYIALFFACSEISEFSNKDYGVIYVLDLNELKKSFFKFICEIKNIKFNEFIRGSFLDKNFLNSGIYVKYYGSNFWRELQQKFSSTSRKINLIKISFKEKGNEFFPSNELFFIPHPSSFNKRMIKQHGCFLYDTLEYGSEIYGKDLEDFISKLDPFNPILYKLYFPISFISNILYRLDLMNINGVSLYMDENGAVIDTKNMKNYNSSFKLSDSKIKGYQNDRN